MFIAGEQVVAHLSMCISCSTLPYLMRVLLANLFTHSQHTLQTIYGSIGMYRYESAGEMITWATVHPALT